jgi:hypothetical protein
MCPGPSHAGKNTDFCGNGMKPTLPDEFRSYNLEAKNGTKGDKWMSTPWRAPGTAPVLDACGSKPQPRLAGVPAAPRPAPIASPQEPALVCTRAQWLAAHRRAHTAGRRSPPPRGSNRATSAPKSCRHSRQARRGRPAARQKSRGRVTQITAADTRDPAPRPRLRSESEPVSDSAVCVRTEIVMIGTVSARSRKH